MATHEFLGLDVGAVRTGLARGNSIARIAQPLSAIKTERLVDDLPQLAKRYSASGIVVGLPRGLNGNETPQTEWVRKWASRAQTKLDLPFYWQDEALTTIEARNKNHESRKKADEDSLAAAVILQDFLDTPEHERMMAQG